MSGVLPYPRWMPPMPPVARKRRPARPQAASVAPTVVAPRPPSTMQAARSRGLTFRASAPAVAIRASCSSSRPTRSAPSSTPTVAGTAPPSRTRCSHSRPTASPSPEGKPWATIVVSSATTGRPAASASATSVEQTTSSGVTALLPPAQRSVQRLRGRARCRPRGSRPRARRRRPSGRRRRPRALRAPRGCLPGRPSRRGRRASRRALRRRLASASSSRSPAKTMSGSRCSSRRQLRRSEGGDAASGGEVDADLCALGPRCPGGASAGFGDGSVQQRIARHVQDVGAAQPLDVDLVGAAAGSGRDQ